MTTKQRIIKKIEAIKNNQLLDDLENLLNSLEKTYREDTFTKEEINSVQEGYEQYLSENTVGNEEAQKQFEEWLKGK